MTRPQLLAMVIVAGLACCLWGCGGGGESALTDQPRDGESGPDRPGPGESPQMTYLTFTIRWPGVPGGQVQPAVIPWLTESISICLTHDLLGDLEPVVINRELGVNEVTQRVEAYSGTLEVHAFAHSGQNAGGDILARGEETAELEPDRENIVTVTLVQLHPPTFRLYDNPVVDGASIALHWIAPMAWDPTLEYASPVGYNIYRSETSGSYSDTPLNAAPVETITAPLAAHSYTDSPPAAGVTYYYVVRAAYTDGLVGPASNEVSAYVDDTGSQIFDQMTGPDGQTLVWVPGGSFMMGSENGYSYERPVHQVTLDGFWIGQCEVTNDQYAAFLNAVRPSYDQIDEWACVSQGLQWGYRYNIEQERYEVVYPVTVASGQGPHPVVRVTWYGAVAYCSHYGYTLPTEAQWEYAAAGPTSRVYPWGTEWDAQKCCNHDNQGPDRRTYPVGSFPTGASWCGALDMAGNVWEWCADWYSATYYEISPALNPPGPESGTYRVLRGGSWNFSLIYCRAAYRFYGSPTRTYHSYFVGFRVSRSRL